MKHIKNITLKKVTKSQWKFTIEERRNREELQKQPENNEQNGNKYTPINNYFKCKQEKMLQSKDINMVAEQIKQKKTKHVSYICYLKETHFRSRDKQTEC